MRISFSIKALMGISAVIAVACGTLSGQSPWWSSIQDSMVWLSLVYAIIAAWSAQGNWRQFARGYAIAGVLYYFMAFDHSYRSLPGPQHATDQAARRLHEAVEELKFRGWLGTGPTDEELQQLALMRGQGLRAATWGPTWDWTQRTANCLMTIAFGCAGGFLFRSLASAGSAKATVAT